MIIKVILLVVLAALGYKMWIPPHPTPLQQERDKYGKESFLDRIVRARWALWATAIAVAMLAACEAAVLVARDHPGPISDTVMSHLVHGDRACVRDVRITPQFLVGWCMVVAGGFGRVQCYRALGPAFTFERSIVKGHELVTTGAYSIVRHPSYVAAAVFVAGTFVAQLTAGSWVWECAVLDSWVARVIVGAHVLFDVWVIMMLFARCAGEDETLRREFGDEWVRWSQRTPARLFPGIY